MRGLLPLRQCQYSDVLYVCSRAFASPLMSILAVAADSRKDVVAQAEATASAQMQIEAAAARRATIIQYGWGSPHAYLTFIK